MKLSTMTDDQKQQYHEEVANTLHAMTKKAIDAADNYQDYLDYMGFAMQEVATPFMQSLKHEEGQERKFTVNTENLEFKILVREPVGDTPSEQ